MNIRNVRVASAGIALCAIRAASILWLSSLGSMLQSCSSEEDAERAAARRRIDDAVESGRLERGMGRAELIGALGPPERVMAWDLLVFPTGWADRQEYVGFSIGETKRVEFAAAGAIRDDGTWHWTGSPTDDFPASSLVRDVPHVPITEAELRSKLGEPAFVLRFESAYFALFERYGGDVWAFVVNSQDDRVLEWSWVETDFVSR